MPKGESGSDGICNHRQSQCLEILASTEYPRHAQTSRPRQEPTTCIRLAHFASHLHSHACLLRSKVRIDGTGWASCSVLSALRRQSSVLSALRRRPKDSFFLIFDRVRVVFVESTPSDRTRAILPCLRPTLSAEAPFEGRGTSVVTLKPWASDTSAPISPASFTPPTSSILFCLSATS